VAVAPTTPNRQFTLAPYIVDFISHGARLIVEVDGAVHDAPEAKARDAARQTFLEGRGYRVIRFSNAEVKTDIGRAVRTILASVNRFTPPPPAPAPQGGGGQGAA